MTSPGGRWVVVPIAGTPGRMSWIPAEQPPSPDGTRGEWHVVPDQTGGPSHWEWMPVVAPPMAAPSVRAAPAPAGSVFRPGRRSASRAAVVAGAAVAVVALAGVVALARSGGGGAAAVVVDDAAVAQAAVTESACQNAKTEPAHEPANVAYQCRGFDLFVYNATHERDLWVADWQRLGRTVMKTGPHWIALKPQR